jgi:hypothetical protein
MARNRKATGTAPKTVEATQDIESAAAQPPESPVTEKPDAAKVSPARDQQEQPAADVNPFPSQYQDRNIPGRL